MSDQTISASKLVTWAVFRFFKLFWASLCIYESKRLYIEKTIDLVIFTSWFIIDVIQESAILKKNFFFKFWQIIVFLGSKKPVFKRMPIKFVNWIHDQGTRIHYTKVSCILAISVNFGRLGLFWAISQKPKKILHHFLFFIAFQTPMDQEKISNL